MNYTRKEFIALSAGGFFGMNMVTRPRRSIPVSRARSGGAIDVKVRELKLVNTWTIARNSSDVKYNVFVRYEKDGVIGIGEAAPNVRYDETPESTVETIESARDLLEKADPWQFVDLGYAIQEITEGQTAAKCAMDMAVMDWITRSLGVPFYTFLGLNRNKAARTSFSIGIDTPEVIQKKIRDAEPYSVLKIKLGRDDDEEIMRAVREVTDKTVRVDINEGWKDKQEALEKIEWLKTLNVEFVEQPMPSVMLEETRWLRERSPLPIVADEAVKKASDIPALAHAFDGINIKLMKSGGLQEALRMIWMARSLGLKIMLGCMIESSVAISAGAHISPLVDWADLDGNLLISNDPFSGATVRNSTLVLPERPGLGIQGTF
ncbi:dipeptide epimerase [bacterium]|nr:dipeptide epimerase [bacterium]